MSLYQAEKLIDLACSTTYVEEARTAALAACQLIRRNGFRLTANGVRATPSARHREPEAPRRAEPAREKPPNGGTWTQASRSGRCESCSTRYMAGDDVYVVESAVWCGRH